MDTLHLRALPAALFLVAGTASATPPDMAGDLARTDLAGSGVLWAQTDDSGQAIQSQNLESVFDNYDCQGADDFVVPEGEVWLVKRIMAVGTYFAGAGVARSENAVFYRNDHGRPGDVIRLLPELPGEDIHFGTLLVPLPEPLKLTPGRYWVSLQANTDFATSGQWGWETTLRQNGKTGVWMNPNDGFQTGCTTYQQLPASLKV